MTLSANSLLYKRIDAVDRVLKQKNLSPWAKNYWKKVYNALQRQHKQKVIYAHTPPFDRVN